MRLIPIEKLEKGNCLQICFLKNCSEYKEREMRLFIAIRFPENVLAELARIQREMKKQGVSGNFSRAENLHLTLAFLGEVKAPRAVSEAMKAVEVPPMELTLGESGRFRGLYWAGLEENPTLFSYTEALRAELKEREIWFDEKAFRPHITLVRRARYEGEGPMPQVPVRKESFEVQKVSLMKSENIGGKLTYTEIYAEKRK